MQEAPGYTLNAAGHFQAREYDSYNYKKEDKDDLPEESDLHARE